MFEGKDITAQIKLETGETRRLVGAFAVADGYVEVDSEGLDASDPGDRR